MVSYSDRLRAVELYIRLGKRVKATIRQLGYPTKNALKSWYREYEQGRDLCVRYPARTPKYSDEQKQAALEYYRTHDHIIALVRSGGLARSVHGVANGKKRLLAKRTRSRSCRSERALDLQHPTLTPSGQ